MAKLKRSKFPRLRGYVTKRPLVVALIFALIVGVIASRLLFFSHADTTISGYTVATNPPISQTCGGGLNIALVADISQSIAPADLQTVESSFQDFVSGLLPGTNSTFSLTEFAGDGQVLQGFTNNVNALDSQIKALRTASYTGSGGTNWTDGLKKAYGTFSTVTSKAPKLLVIATDGDPTSGSADPVGGAVTEANIIKRAGIHMLAIGLDSTGRGGGRGGGGAGGPNTTNLETITGPKLNTGAGVNDDVITTDYSTLDAELLDLAQTSCGTGTGTGTGGTGTGTGGTGTGTGGSGTGSGGSGTGSTGSGSGTTAGPKPSPSSSPNPAPTPEPNPSPKPAPAPIASPSPTPKPAPTPESVGTQVQPPERTPSPFYDGKQYAPGSIADTLANAVVHRGLSGWWYALIAVVVLLAAGGGFLFWRRRNARPAGKLPKSSARSGGSGRRK